MKISKNHQGYTFAVFLKDVHRIPELVCINGFSFIPSNFRREELRSILKIIDYENYPRDDKLNPKSYTELSDKELSVHMEFIRGEVKTS